MKAKELIKLLEEFAEFDVYFMDAQTDEFSLPTITTFAITGIADRSYCEKTLFLEGTEQ